MDHWDDEHWRERVAVSFDGAGASGEMIDRVVRSSRYVRSDVTDAGQLAELIDSCEKPLAIYFALPPAVADEAVEALATFELPAGTRLVMEKPFGTDLSSARSLNRLVTRLVPEDHVYRVDHFLGMSTVFNIVGLRFANRIFEPVLSAGPRRGGGHRLRRDPGAGRAGRLLRPFRRTDRHDPEPPAPGAVAR